jgi:hypothetical protein
VSASNGCETGFSGASVTDPRYAPIDAKPETRWYKKCAPSGKNAGELSVDSKAGCVICVGTPPAADTFHNPVKAYVQAAPTGAAVTFTIYVGGAAWLTLTIPAGQTVVVATPSQITALSQIPANTAVSIGITAVGTTFPGASLSVFIYS